MLCVLIGLIVLNTHLRVNKNRIKNHLKLKYTLLFSDWLDCMVQNCAVNARPAKTGWAGGLIKAAAAPGQAGQAKSFFK